MRFRLSEDANGTYFALKCSRVLARPPSVFLRLFPNVVHALCLYYSSRRRRVDKGLLPHSSGGLFKDDGWMAVPGERRPAARGAPRLPVVLAKHLS